MSIKQYRQGEVTDRNVDLLTDFVESVVDCNTDEFGDESEEFEKNHTKMSVVVKDKIFFSKFWGQIPVFLFKLEKFKKLQEDIAKGLVKSYECDYYFVEEKWVDNRYLDEYIKETSDFLKENLEKYKISNEKKI